MGAFADLDGVINALTGGGSGAPETLFFYRDARIPAAAPTAPVVARWHSLWNVIGFPSHASYPSASAVYPDNTTTGGLRQTDPAGSYQKWLLGGIANSSQPGTLMLYDRLAHYGGLSGTVTSAQSCSLTLSSRYTGAASAGNQLWVEIGTAVGATSTTISANYTDQDGNSSITSESTLFGATGNLEAQRMTQIPLAQGDSGVRAVASVTLAATTGTAGAFSVVIARPLAYFSFPANPYVSVLDLIAASPGPVEIKTDACLCLAWFAGSTTWPQLYGSITMCEVAD